MGLVQVFLAGIHHVLQLEPDTDDCVMFQLEKNTFRYSHPQTFGKIRSVLHIDASSFLEAMKDGENASLESSGGKSGSSIAYLSEGRRYLLKTLPAREARVLRRLAPLYLKYLEQHDGVTLLPRMLALIRVGPPKRRKYATILTNVFLPFPTSSMPSLSRVYDLKGSTVDRKSKPGENVLKDQDFLEGDWHPPSDALLSKMLESDVEWLAFHNLMDYSLLMGVSNPLPSTPPWIVTNDECSVVLGFIDVLCPWTMKKKAAHRIKSIRREGKDLSTVQPSYYASRMLDFLVVVFQQK